MKQHLVSAIIPCYNAERWIGAAIQSCLDQSYRPIEIIVIDDGSSDGSLEIIKSFGNAVHWETGPNQGGSATRNRGFALSSGEYIQWLDADDLLAPEKLQYQVPVLQTNQADVVGGWWRHFNETPSGSFVESELQQPRISADPVTSLISAGGWFPSFSYLMTRQIVKQVAGWDERLTCLQDIDLILRIAMQGGRFAVVPYLCGYYRRPLQPTVSTRNKTAFMQACYDNYNHIYHFSEANGWNEQRRTDLVKMYGWLARYYFEYDRAKFEQCLKRIRSLEPTYVPGPPLLRLLTHFFGYRNAEFIALLYRKTKLVLKKLAK
jgi:glycosyltransferase involved in cell wall biosynthesis